MFDIILPNGRVVRTALSYVNPTSNISPALVEELGLTKHPLKRKKSDLFQPVIGDSVGRSQQHYFVTELEISIDMHSHYGQVRKTFKLGPLFVMDNLCPLILGKDMMKLINYKYQLESGWETLGDLKVRSYPLEYKDEEGRTIHGSSTWTWPEGVILDTCESCGLTLPQLKKCPCLQVFYCTTVCQKKHWALEHKHTCKAKRKKTTSHSSGSNDFKTKQTHSTNIISSPACKEIASTAYSSTPAQCDQDRQVQPAKSAEPLTRANMYGYDPFGFAIIVAYVRGQSHLTIDMTKQHASSSQPSTFDMRPHLTLRDRLLNTSSYFARFRMSFPSRFAGRTMVHVLEGLAGVIVGDDVIIICAKDFEDLRSSLRATLERFEELRFKAIASETKIGHNILDRDVMQNVRKFGLATLPHEL